MKTTPEALKDLYVALGGEEAQVEAVSTNVGMLNAIAEKLGGEAEAQVIPEAVENIAAVAQGGGSGGGDVEFGIIRIINNTSLNLTFPSFAIADGKLIRNTSMLTAGGKTTISVPLSKTGNLYYPTVTGEFIFANGASKNLSVSKSKNMGMKVLAQGNDINNSYKFVLSAYGSINDGASYELTFTDQTIS